MRLIGGFERQDWQGPTVNWFKKNPRVPDQVPAARSLDGPASWGDDTEARLEHGSQSGVEFAEEPQGPRPPAPTAASIAVPPTLGRYEVRRLLGAGGFGAVYLGHDSQLDRPVAIKLLRAGGRQPADPGRQPADPSRQRADAERSRQEARRLAQLHHPGIVAVHDIGVHEGSVYIVSDYLEGGDLRSWMQENRASWQDATRIAIAVLDALGHAHARRIVHRDVKPANIILTAERRPVLVDFGLALSDEQAGAGEKGFVSGTPHYMSPEQAKGIAHRIDGRTDLYSVGVVLYELLTGRLPFRATDVVELLRQVRDDEPQPPRQLVRDIPQDLERACLKALAKRQPDRYTTAGDFAEDLQRVLQAAAPVTTAFATPPPAEAPPLPTPTRDRADLLSPTPLPVAVDSRTSSSVRRAREAERRQLTVLVCGCDVFESEPYLALDSEDQADLLRAFLETCETAVQQFGGTIVQCSEKGLLVCFGFPLAVRRRRRTRRTDGAGDPRGHDDPRRPAPNQPTGCTLDPWVGIHTGAAIVESKAGAVSLVGEARNVAVRLEDVAVAGQVICTEASHRLFQGRFQCASLGRQKIKSVAQPVELFRVEQVAVAGSPIDAVAPAELSPLTGRDQEVGLLKDRWDQAQGGHGTGRPADRRAGIGQVAPGAHDEAARPGTDGGRGSGRAGDRVALLAAFSEHGAVSGHRLLRAGPRLRPRGAAAGAVRPDASPPGAVRSGPAGNRPAVGVAAVAADPGPLPAAVAVAGPPAGRNLSNDAGLAAHARRPEADPVHRRGSALGGRVDAGVPGAVPRGGPARLHPDAAHLPSRVQDAVAGGRPPDHPGA